MKEIWKPLNGYPGYKISNLGRLKRTRVQGRYPAGWLMKPRRHERKYVYQIKVDKKIYLDVEEITKKHFPGFRIHPGWHGWTLKQNKQDNQKLKKNYRPAPVHVPKKLKPSTRPCHDCGRPTTNYRCDACWRKIRGSSDDYVPSFVESYTCHIAL